MVFLQRSVQALYKYTKNEGFDKEQPIAAKLSADQIEN
jgi:hypothetical protein